MVEKPKSTLESRALTLTCFTPLLCAALVLYSCARDSEFKQWGLPQDLPDYLGQLRILKVPSLVTHLNWVPPNLEELDASATAITDIPILSIGLERLDVHAAKNLRHLASLPPSLRDLDIRFTQVEEPWRFPQDLESLALGGEYVRTLEGLKSSSILELHLDRVPNLQSSVGMPASLRFLSISGATFSELIDLPLGVTELRLEGTQIRSLDNLPDSLQSLVLIGNPVMEVELPPFLLDLTVDRLQKRPSVEALHFLNRLEGSYVGSSDRLPPLLRELRTPAYSLKRAPTTLRRLYLTNEMNDGSWLSSLPSSLQELRWPGGYELNDLPAGLKHLDIHATRLKDLSELPSQVWLESLDISWTAIPIRALPPSLYDLRYRFCPFSSISDLPRRLRTLDIAGSRRVRWLGALPPQLQRLNISETSISELPELPASLADLDISSTSIRSLTPLKELKKLRRLTVHSGQLESLVGLPESVDALLFVDLAPGMMPTN